MKRFYVFAVVLLTVVFASACNGQGTTPPVTPATKPAVVAPGTPVDPKSATAYIQVRTPVELSKLFLTLSNNNEISQSFRGFLMNYAMRQASGSGFAVERTSREGSLVVTNRHVVAGIDEPQVSFDGGNTNITARILFIDRDYDLAILEITNLVPGLPVISAYNDMQDVIAVGYPGMNVKGNFQVTRGNISNKCLEDKQITNSNKKNCWIQHTASIDPGSSGGPLVTKENKVVGVNTAIVTSHHNVYVAVPGDAVQNAIKTAETIRVNRTNADWMKSELKSSCHKFVSEMSSGNAHADRLLPYISNKIVAKKGIAAFSRYVENPEVAQIFVSDPYVGMQASIALHIRGIFLENQGVLVSERCDNISPTDNVLDPSDDVRITVSLHSKSIELSWVFERGSWRLSDFN